MIHSIRIRNFRCLRDVHLELGPLTVLVGPNGSGKSTLLDSLAVLARCTRSPLYNKMGSEFTFARPGWQGSGGFEHAVFGHHAEQDIEFDTVLATPEGPLEKRGEGRYYLRLGRRDGRLQVVGEKLEWHGPGIDLQLDCSKPPEGLPKWLDFVPLPRDVTLPFRVFPLRHERATDPVVRAGLAVQAALGPSHIHEFVPSRLATPSPHIEQIRSDGYGLVSVLDELLGRDRTLFGQIERDLKCLFPEIEGLIIQPFQRQRGDKELLLRTTGSNGEILDIPAGLAPSGVLVVIALLWAMHCRPYAVLGLDEIEVHLHPWLIGKVMELIQSMASSCQVILATHSTGVLNSLSDLDVVRICERDQLGCHILAPGKSVQTRKDLRALFQHAIGAMWFSGHLGGVPKEVRG